jgi:hypothetical protein
MSTNSGGFPSFWNTLREAQALSVRRRGWLIAYTPWLFLILFDGALLGSWLLHNILKIEIATENSIQIFSGMMVVGGVLAAVSVACMNQIYVSVADPAFGDYLREEKVFEQLLFWPQFTLLIQIAFVIVCAIGLFLSLSVKLNGYLVFSVCCGVALMIYTAFKTWNLIETMRLLAWHRQDYLFLLQQYEQQSKRSNGRRVAK